MGRKESIEPTTKTLFKNRIPVPHEMAFLGGGKMVLSVHTTSHLHSLEHLHLLLCRLQEYYTKSIRLIRKKEKKIEVF